MQERRMNVTQLVNRGNLPLCTEYSDEGWRGDQMQARICPETVVFDVQEENAKLSEPCGWRRVGVPRCLLYRGCDKAHPAQRETASLVSTLEHRRKKKFFFFFLSFFFSCCNIICYPHRFLNSEQPNKIDILSGEPYKLFGVLSIFLCSSGSTATETCETLRVVRSNYCIFHIPIEWGI